MHALSSANPSAAQLTVVNGQFGVKNWRVFVFLWFHVLNEQNNDALSPPIDPRFSNNSGFIRIESCAACEVNISRDEIRTYDAGWSPSLESSDTPALPLLHNGKRIRRLCGSGKVLNLSLTMRAIYKDYTFAHDEKYSPSLFLSLYLSIPYSSSSFLFLIPRYSRTHERSTPAN